MKFKRALKNNSLMLYYVFKFVPKMFFSVLNAEVVNAAQTVICGPIALKFVFEALSKKKSFEEIALFLIFLGVVALLNSLAIPFAYDYMVPKSIPILIKKLQGMLFEKAASLDLSCYDNPKFYTDFVWAISQAETRAIDIFFTTIQIFAKSVIILGFTSVLLTFEPVIFVFVLISIIIKLITNVLSVKYSFKSEVESKPLERERDYCGRVFYLANYAKELRLSTIHKNLMLKLKSKTAEIIKIRKKYSKKIVILNFISDTITNAFLLNLASYSYLAYKLIVLKNITFGVLLAVYDSVWSMIWRVEDIIKLVPEFVKQSMYIEKFRAFLEYEAQIVGKEKLPPKEPKEIKFNNVSFVYDDTTKPVLKNINLTIKPYEKIAIVGYNGAGKTTITKLLMRLYDTTKGEITVGGVNIKEIDLPKYRDCFGVVFQDYQLFAATVAENTVMDRVSSKDREKVSKALCDSGFSEKLLDLRHGIDTPVTREFEEHGMNFSGGEAQKIAISRIFFKSCSCVILDEPSSALDPVSEYNLNETMLEAAKDKTVIFISHRLSTTKMADTIYMIDDGEIVEQGKHDELMALDGKYAEMFNLQAEKYQKAY